LGSGKGTGGTGSQDLVHDLRLGTENGRAPSESLEKGPNSVGNEKLKGTTGILKPVHLGRPCEPSMKVHTRGDAETSSQRRSQVNAHLTMWKSDRRPDSTRSKSFVFETDGELMESCGQHRH
jgi:hypothetical protein